MSKALDVSAFPIPHDDRPGAYMAETGMTLRDYFAAKIMATFMQGAVLPPDFDAKGQLEFAAKRAYEAADAMLQERAK